MTSPITHEKIIEVLRPVVEATTVRDGSFLFLSGITEEYRDAVRDLYQRLQAEKEGGGQKSEPSVGLAGSEDKPATDAPLLGRTRPRLSGPTEEPGPVVSAPTPASATAGTGRAIAELVAEARALVEDGDSYGTRARNVTTIYTRQIIERLIEALVSERQRGLEEGERIGIEKAAKVAEEEAASYPTDPGEAARVAVAWTARAIRQRALNTGDPQT